MSEQAATVEQLVVQVPEEEALQQVSEQEVLLAQE